MDKAMEDLDEQIEIKTGQIKRAMALMLKMGSGTKKRDDAYRVIRDMQRDVDELKSRRNAGVRGEV